MTLTTATTRNDYTGNSSTSNYDYTFKIYSDSELLVVVKETSTSVETTLTLDTDYTVNDAGEEAGGSIDLVDVSQDWVDSDGYLATGYTLTVKRNLELTQETDIRNQSSFYPETIEDALDRIVMITQQQDDKLQGAITLPETVSPSDFDTTLPSDIAVSSGNQKVIIVNSDATGFDLVDLEGAIGNAPQYSSDANYEAGNDTPDGGEVYYNTTSNKLRTYDSEYSEWYNLVTNSDSFSSSRVVVTDTTGKTIESSTITEVELGYLDGVTDLIQDQIDGKISASSTDTLTNKTIDADSNTITNLENENIKSSANINFSKMESLTSSRALIANSSGVVGVSSVTSTELGYISGVTSSIQSQIDEKISSSSTDTLTNKTISSSDNSISLAASSITSGTLGVTRGGTNLSGYTKGDMIYSDATNSLGKLGIGLSGQVLSANSSGVPEWIDSTTSGVSGVNYVTNYGGESAVTGWTTYADGAATPTDLTGGSPSGTIARTTSNVLRGNGSLLYASGALGDGVYYAITPDRADLLKGSVLFIKFDYEFTGTVSDDNYRVYVYDVYNSNLITPIGYSIYGMVSGVVSTHIANFQLPTNGTTFRIAIHQKVSSPGGNIKFDNFTCGPLQYLNVGIATDWKSDLTFTPSSSAFGTVTENVNFYRRVGDSIRVFGSFKTGTTTTSTAEILLPSSIVPDFDKMFNTSYTTLRKVIGRASATVSSSTTVFILNLVMDYNDTSIYISRERSSTNFVKGTASSIIDSSQYLSYEFEIPVQGWGNAVTMPYESGEGRTVFCSYYKSGSTQTVTTGTDTLLTFSAKIDQHYDTHLMFDTSTNTATIPISGHYRIYCRALLASAGSAGQRYISIYQNDSSISSDILPNSISTSVNCSNKIYKEAYLNAGDTIKFYFTQDSGSTATIGSGINTFFSISRIPSAGIQLYPETINMRYYGAGTTLTSAGTAYKLTFGTKVYDTHGGYTSGTYYFPISGRYRVNCFVRASSDVTVSAQSYLYLYATVDSTTTTYLDLTPLYTGTYYPRANGSIVVNVSAGSYIEIYASRSVLTTSFSISSGDQSYLEIERIGN